MGTASSGSWQDPMSFYYNPGAIDFHNHFSFSIVNQGFPPGIGRLAEQGILNLSGRVLYDEVVVPEPPWLPTLRPDMRYVSSFYKIPFTNIGTAGINVVYFNSGEIDIWDETGTYIGTYGSYDIMTGLSYGHSFFNRLGLGITAKYIYSYMMPHWAYILLPEWVIDKGGIGLNLRNIEIDIARYFDYNTYHVQMNFYAVKPSENIINNKKLNKALIIGSSALTPGGGQFYKGEGIKGSLFLIPSLYLGNLYLSSEPDNKNYLALAGVGLLYAASVLEAILTE